VLERDGVSSDRDLECDTINREITAIYLPNYWITTLYTTILSSQYFSEYCLESRIPDGSWTEKKKLEKGHGKTNGTIKFAWISLIICTVNTTIMHNEAAS
jgi:hypothetical protein